MFVNDSIKSIMRLLESVNLIQRHYIWDVCIKFKFISISYNEIVNLNIVNENSSLCVQIVQFLFYD